MAWSRYFVVRQREEWKVMHNGEFSPGFASQKDAVHFAVQRAKSDERIQSQVLVQGDDMAFREEGRFGM